MILEIKTASAFEIDPHKYYSAIHLTTTLDDVTVIVDSITSMYGYSPIFNNMCDNELREFIAEANEELTKRNANA